MGNNAYCILGDPARWEKISPVNSFGKTAKGPESIEEYYWEMLQILSGYLNFLGHVIYTGQTFTRRIYTKFAPLTGKDREKRILKPFHHVRIDAELRFDCQVWEIFWKII